jgi:MFS family permease
VLLLAVIVWRMSATHGGLTPLFVFILLTRAVGQSALSVASITAVGKDAERRSGMAMGIYAVLLSVFFIAAFVGVGAVVSARGWRVAWDEIALSLGLGVAPLTALLLRDSSAASPEKTAVSEADVSGFTLPRALATPAFWVLGLSIALFGLVTAGIGLFNESILAERGFDAETFHQFLGVTTGVALLGQMGSGWLSLRWTQTQLLGSAMLLYGIGLGTLPLLSSHAQLWIFAGIFGLAGGMITVVFFAVWGQVFGRIHLGRIQGAAQMLTVFASALGPVLFAECHQRTESYAPLLYILCAVVVAFGVAAWVVKIPSPGN